MGADRELIDRYERIADLAEVEATAAIAGDLETFHVAVAAREQLRRTLPDVAPAAARPALERALAAQAAAEHTLKVGLAEARAGLIKLDRSRAQVLAYGGATVPLVDASS